MKQVAFARSNSQLMTVEEVARYLGIHAITVYRMLKKTDIPATKLLGKWRFKKDVLDRWLESRMEERSLPLKRRR
ncbi:MAG: helix-turn-helix domain-containing protein [Candidatus Omnitrophica bacterium]|nr:helix-turn-helix domain-containing protein [Candidatus Omnitrophota bacterium]